MQTRYRYRGKYRAPRVPGRSWSLIGRAVVVAASVATLTLSGVGWATADATTVDGGWTR